MSWWWVAVAGLLALCDGSAGLAAVAVVAAGLLVVLLARSLSGLVRTGTPASISALALSDQGRPHYVRLSDPDAAGRPRPRAPSVNLVCT